MKKVKMKTDQKEDRLKRRQIKREMDETKDGSK